MKWPSSTASDTGVGAGHKMCSCVRLYWHKRQRVCMYDPQFALMTVNTISGVLNTRIRFALSISQCMYNPKLCICDRSLDDSQHHQWCAKHTNIQTNTDNFSDAHLCVWIPTVQHQSISHYLQWNWIWDFFFNTPHGNLVSAKQTDTIRSVTLDHWNLTWLYLKTRFHLCSVQLLDRFTNYNQIKLKTMSNCAPPPPPLPVRMNLIIV